MNYFVLRGGKEYGPYSLDDLRRYTGSGEILLGDRARADGTADWMPVSQILNNRARVAPGSGEPVPLNGTYPLPPDLHWALVLLFGILTCGMFFYVWMFVQANYVKKLDSAGNALLYYAIGVGVLLGAGAFTVYMDDRTIRGLLQLAAIVLIIMGHFNIRSSLWRHFNQTEPISLELSGLMTFFFNTVYFQYHFNRIRRWRTSGVLA